MPVAGVTVEPPIGLACWEGPASPMRHAHRHDDLELNLSPGGPLGYELGGRHVEVPTGHLVAFWGAVPHRLTSCPGDRDLHWVTVPVAVLRAADAGLLRRLLGPEPLVATTASDATEVAQLRGWHDDLATRDPERHAIAALEIEARLRRLALGARSGVATVEGNDAALVMAAFVIDHHDEPIGVADVAAAASIHPHHAMHVFRAAMGTTIGRYLAQVRVASAQRLLLTTDTPLLQVGLEAGFGSQSQFYAQFVRACGTSPGSYRRARGSVDGDGPGRAPQRHRPGSRRRDRDA